MVLYHRFNNSPSAGLIDEARPLQIIIKMAQHLDLRCVWLSDPSTFGAGSQMSQRSQPKHVLNPA